MKLSFVIICLIAIVILLLFGNEGSRIPEYKLSFITEAAVNFSTYRKEFIDNVGGEDEDIIVLKMKQNVELADKEFLYLRLRYPFNNKDIAGLTSSMNSLKKEMLLYLDMHNLKKEVELLKRYNFNNEIKKREALICVVNRMKSRLNVSKKNNPISEKTIAMFEKYIKEIEERNGGMVAGKKTVRPPKDLDSN